MIPEAPEKRAQEQEETDARYSDRPSEADAAPTTDVRQTRPQQVLLPDVTPLHDSRRELSKCHQLVAAILKDDELQAAMSQWNSRHTDDIKKKVQELYRKHLEELGFWGSNSKHPARKTFPALLESISAAINAYPELFTDVTRDQMVQAFGPMQCWGEYKRIEEKMGKLIEIVGDRKCPRAYDPLTEAYENIKDVFKTRIDIAEELARHLIDPKKRLIIVVDPIGWGKDVLMGAALSFAGTHIHRRVVDLTGLDDPKKLMDRLLSVCVSDEEYLGVEHDRRGQINLLRADLTNAYGDPAKCCLFFLNTDTTEEGEIKKDLWQVIRELAESGLRCVVEKWTDRGLESPRHLNEQENIAVVTDMPELTEGEVTEWAKSQGISEEMAKSLQVLNGYPQAIRHVFPHLKRRAYRGLAVDRDIVLRKSNALFNTRRFREFETHLEDAIGMRIMPIILQWCGLVVGLPFPQSRLTREERVQCEDLVELGIARVSENGIMPAGWFRLYCRERLKGQTEDLHLRADHFQEVSGIDRDRVCNDLLDIADKLGGKLCDQISTLVRELEGRCAPEDLGEDQFEGRPPAPVQAGTALRLYTGLMATENAEDSGFELFVLQQLLRNRLVEQALILLQRLLSPERRPMLSGALRRRNLIKLKRAIYCMRPFERGVVPILGEIVDAVLKADMSTQESRYHAAEIMQLAGIGLCRWGQKVEATRIVGDLSNLLHDLPWPAYPPSLYRWRARLQFNFHTLQHLISNGYCDALDALLGAFSVAVQVLDKFPDDVQWKSRYVRLLCQLRDVLRSERGAESGDHVREKLAKMKVSPAFQLVLLALDKWAAAETENPPSIKSLLREQMKRMLKKTEI